MSTFTACDTAALQTDGGQNQTGTLPSTHICPHVCASTHKCIHKCGNTHTPKITSMWSTYLKLRELQFVTFVFLIYITKKCWATPSVDIIALSKYYILPLPTAGKITASENRWDFFFFAVVNSALQFLTSLVHK